MHAGRAFVAGVIGACAMSLVEAWLRFMGIQIHIELYLAQILGTGSWIVGFLVHLLVGGIVAMIYALVFEYVFAQGGVGAGVLLGAINTVLAGFIWAGFEGPGKFWSSYGPAGIASLFLVHMIYGAIVGGLYTPEHTYAYD